ncbi:hypothetical protein D1AOALGA4SA_11535 [Olavius algarvensis Delta 1 endosymbiont]|nr:hypothetical protein D1AOALGA4SA_11535 [Olavius algarvensis Delta 1 endosymbiont]
MLVRRQVSRLVTSTVRHKMKYDYLKNFGTITQKKATV